MARGPSPNSSHPVAPTLFSNEDRLTARTTQGAPLMAFRKTTLSYLAATAFFAAAAGCSSAEPPGSGQAGQGGSAGSGGAPASGSGGGPISTGGSGGSAGSAGSAGSPATGGQPGTGGQAGSGGSGGGGGVDLGGSGGVGGGGPTLTSCTPARPHDMGSKTVTLQSGGKSREYILHVPPGYDGTKPVPLVFDIHGFTSWASEQVERSKWDEMADQEGFILIAPDGVEESWNAGRCCGGNGEDDVRFFRDMVTKATAELCIDSKRVYVSGHSNGGAMTYRLACEAADIFAAVAPVCGGMFMSVAECNPSRPIPVMAIRSTGDPTVTIDSADDDIEEWLTNNQCDESAVTTSGVCKTYSSCAGGAQVKDCRPPGNHGFFYASNNTFLVPNEVWPFLKQFSLP